MFTRHDERATAVVLPKVVCLGLYGVCEIADRAVGRQRVLAYLHDHVVTLSASVYAVCGVLTEADLLLAECCVQAGLPVKVLLPKPQEAVQIGTDPTIWMRWEHVISSALSIEILDSEQYDDAEYEVVLKLLQESSAVLVLSDGIHRPAETDALLQVDSLGKSIAILNVVTGAIEQRDVTSEDMRIQDSELQFLNQLHDIGLHDDSGTDADVAHAWFAKIDRVATQVAPRLRRSAAIPIWYMAMASVITGAVAHSTSRFWMIASTLLGVVAVSLPRLLRLDKTQSLWARTRVAAEVTRSVLATWDAPSHNGVDEADTVNELGAVLRSLYFLKLQAGDGRNTDLAVFRETYRAQRILPQIAYFSKHAGRAHAQALRSRKIVWSCGVLSIVLSLLWLADHSGWSEVRGVTHGPWFGIGLSILFQAAAVTGALEVINDGARRQQRYLELHRFLTQQERQFARLHTWPAVVRATRKVERALLVEVLEWRSLAQHRKHSRR
jgi:hypothetical protein